MSTTSFSFWMMLAAVAIGACSSGGEPRTPADDPAPAPTPAAGGALDALRQNAAAITARAEHGDERVKVAHILVAFQGAMRATVTRTREAAEQRAAELYARAADGGDFLELMRENSDDSGPGVYGMTTGAPDADYYARQAMAGAFGDTGWRLAVGEIGVAAYDAETSPFGWHIIKRLE